MIYRNFLYIITIAGLINNNCFSQLPVTIPSGPVVNVNFGKGAANPGPPLSVGYTSYNYAKNICPAPGFYSVVNYEKCFDTSHVDAGHIFFGPHPLDGDSGYMMLANIQAAQASTILFADTVKNLCSNNAYLFWAAILNLSKSTCFYPNLTFTAQTMTGQVIQNFHTGGIGSNNDQGAPFFGYNGIDLKAPFPFFYGGIFTLPAGVTDVIIKILADPSMANPDCTATLAIDNILLNAVGPDITISNPLSPGAWILGSCFQSNQPVNINGDINSGYYNFGSGEFVNSTLTNPAVQWQQSVDDGYSWTDIPGETNLNLSHIFSVPDTFFLRLRASENYNINNPNCSVISNVMQVQVDGLPTNYNITSNSPVCTDSDIVFNISGGASYFISGPNGYSDNTSYPHIYHPVLADSGWYHVKIISFGGCSVDDSTFVKVYGPDIKVKSSLDSICYGKGTQLQASGGATYLWSPPDGLSNANISNPTASPNTTTTYKIKVTDNTGCGAFGAVTVTLRDSILKAAIAGPVIVCPNDAALFKDTSIGKVSKWFWSFGNGETSNMRNPAALHYVTQHTSTVYPVELIVTDSATCTDTAFVLIKAVNNCYIAVPSAFTPNQDGLNDYLYPLNAYKATNLLFRIYNRFGKLVFETKDWTKKWDGTLANIPQATGTYIWILEYTDDDNKRVFIKGTSVLLR